MSVLTVTPVQLTQLGAVTGRVAAQVRADQQQLRAQLAPLFGPDWSGVAASRFVGLYENFDQHARGLCDALDGIGRLLARAGLTYADVETRIAASFR
jgi:WXG100 family type VII secretion target